MTWEVAQAQKTRLNTSDCISSLIHENLPHHSELFSFVCILASHFIIIPEAFEIAFLRFLKRREALYSVTTASFLPFAFFLFWVRGDGWIVFFFFFT